MTISALNFCFDASSNKTSEDTYLQSQSDIPISADTEQFQPISASNFIFNRPNFTPNRIFQTFRLFDNPRVLVFDFATDQLSNESFLRISDYVEHYAKKKIDPVMNNRSTGISYDLRLSDLIDFLNQVPNISVEEARIRDFLLAKRLIEFDVTQGKYVPSTSEEVALLTVAPEYDTSERLRLFLHEYSHALYFVDPVFRSKVSELWDQLSLKEKEFITAALKIKSYRSGEKWLLETELAAAALENTLSDPYDGTMSVFHSALHYCQDFSRSHSIKDCKTFFRSDMPNPYSLSLKLHSRYWKLFQSYLPEDIACLSEEMRPRKIVELFSEP